MKQDQPDPVLNYLNQLDRQQDREAISTLDRLIRSWQPQLEVELWQSMGYPIIGYGRASYRLSRGRVNDWFIVGLAAHKSYLSLYVWGVDDGQYLLDRHRDGLGRVKVGRACLNFQSPDDLNLKNLKKVVQKAVDLQAGFSGQEPGV